MIKREKGFTLIELLIVIVIIGILAGVLIAVIDPIQQQNRARDAGVKASINKVALATEGYVSAYGTTPDEVQFIANLSSNVTANGTTCDTTNAYDCMFSVQGNALDDTCGGTSWSGTGESQCYYRYESSADSVAFAIYAKSYGLTSTVFKYDNQQGEIQHCDSTGASCVSP